MGRQSTHQELLPCLLAPLRVLLATLDSAMSRTAYSSDVQIFSDWLAGIGLDALETISYPVMVDYRAYLRDNYAGATANRRFVVARRLLSEAVNLHLLADNPATLVKIKGKPQDSQPHTALTEKEAGRLLDAVDDTTRRDKRDYALLLLLLIAGIRRTECAACTWADISFKQEHHVLTVQYGKGGKWRDVPLRADVYRALLDYQGALNRFLTENGRGSVPSHFPLFTGFYKGDKPSFQGISDKQIANIVLAYAVKAGITATPHDLRATAITFMIDTGLPIVKVQRVAGHESPDTTAGYYTRKLELDESPVYKIKFHHRREQL